MAGNIPGEAQESPRISRKLPSLINSVGQVTLPQYRAQSILDIAGRVVQADSVDQFLDELLPYPSSRRRSLRISKRPPIHPSRNPFRTLKDAGNMSEEKVVKLFAAALKKHKLTPGMGLGLCQYKPDTRKTSRKDKRREDAPKVDMLRQKIDAALFRERYLPKDGRPHWPDQGVPVEFKGGKLGVALDAFQDQEDETVEEPEDEEDVEDPQDDDGVGGEEDVEVLLDVEEDEEDEEDEDSESGSDDESESDESNESDDEESPTVANPPLEPCATTRKEVRGQLTTYSELLQLIQHRVAVFMLLILGRRFRLLRWDRAGVIVTKSVDYFRYPDALCEFLWRVSHLSDAALGFDPSAIRLSASDPEWDDMDQHAIARKSDVNSAPRVLAPNELPLFISDAVSENQPYHVFDYVRKMFAKSIADSRWPRFKLSVSAGPRQTRSFLVGKPAFSANGAVGRATRGYIAVDCETGRFVWLKDSWRSAYEGVEQEGLILQRLNKEPSIKDVPTLVCHGDVFGQRTLTASWWERANPLPPSEHTESSTPVTQRESETAPQDGPRGVKRRKREEEPSESVHDQPSDVPKLRVGCRIRHHQHYRLVVKEVGMPLKRFQSALQLTYILLDCLTTHHLAATCPDLHIIHRDISDSNIIILPKVTFTRNNWILNWTGILTDWETSRPIDKQPGTGARQPEHTGSWQFTSVNLLTHAKGVKIQDELESIFFILVYYSVRYLQSSISDREAVATFLDEVFDCFTVKDGNIKCRPRKYTVMKHGKLEYFNPDRGLERVMFNRNGSPLDHLIAEMLKRFSANYKAMWYDLCISDMSQNPAEVSSQSQIHYQGVPLVYDLDKHAELDDDPDTHKYEAALGPQPFRLLDGDIPPEPTAEERDIGADIWGHRWMAWMFLRSLRTPGWESIMRVKRDRVPRGWVSPHPPIPRDVSTEVTGL